MFQCQLNPCFPGVPCVNTAPGFRCGKCPLGFTGPEITGVGVSYAKTHKQVQQPKQYIGYIFYILFCLQNGIETVLLPALGFYFFHIYAVVSWSIHKNTIMKVGLK